MRRQRTIVRSTRLLLSVVDRGHELKYTSTYAKLAHVHLSTFDERRTREIAPASSPQRRATESRNAYLPLNPLAIGLFRRWEAMRATFMIIETWNIPIGRTWSRIAVDKLPERGVDRGGYDKGPFRVSVGLPLHVHADINSRSYQDSD